MKKQKLTNLSTCPGGLTFPLPRLNLNTTDRLSITKLYFSLYACIASSALENLINAYLTEI